MHPSPHRFNASRRHALVVILAVIAFILALARATNRESTADEVLFSACLTLALATALVFFTRRIGLGLLLAAGLVLALRTISLVKQSYLGTLLYASDLLYFGNGNTLDVIAHYPQIWHPLALRGALALGALAVCIAWERPLWRRIRTRWRLLLQLAGGFACLIALWALAAPTGPFRHIHARGEWEEITSTSPLTSFVLSLYRMHVDIPAPDPQLADRYDWGEPATPESPPANPPERRLPDIVVVLEESTFDPAILADCTIRECRSAMFDADAYTLAHGPLQVHTIGGGTWTSEFTFFSGMPSTLFGRAGLYAPFNLAPHLRYALPRVLKEHGYRNIAVYPMGANFLDAKRAYEFYGFDAFHDAAEFNLGWESSDLAIEQELEKIYRRERASSDQPLFLMLLTMRQHGPHSDAYAKLPKPYDHPLFPQLDDKLNLCLSNYLARLSGSLEALTRLQTMLFASGRPAILAHFGDHQPSFDGYIARLRGADAVNGLGDPRMLTYYMIRSNDPAAPKHGYPVLDLAFLAGLILDTAEIPKGPFFTANAALRERCKGRYLDCPDKGLLDSYLSFVFAHLHSLSR
ncbi:MAG: sulfatase-like hydrolase/transferase [Proteobacteria bacterium]|uniref:sulfatase-like hydrolase/transferase n=1 Tax=Rudaea sp. TaxID=2136325 RepID=UPI0037840831|nr:sulfatase-like hydrolase/transferase [Pseudomonadota bacterium]